MQNVYNMLQIFAGKDDSLTKPVISNQRISGRKGKKKCNGSKWMGSGAGMRMEGVGRRQSVLQQVYLLCF